MVAIPNFTIYKAGLDLKWNRTWNSYITRMNYHTMDFLYETNINTTVIWLVRKIQIYFTFELQGHIYTVSLCCVFDRKYTLNFGQPAFIVLVCGHCEVETLKIFIRKVVIFFKIYLSLFFACRPKNPMCFKWIECCTLWVRIFPIYRRNKTIPFGFIYYVPIHINDFHQIYNSQWCEMRCNLQKVPHALSVKCYIYINWRDQFICITWPKCKNASRIRQVEDNTTQAQSVEYIGVKDITIEI